MSYFGGLGAGKGWNTFNFILNPVEFELVFKDLQFSFVIDSKRVEMNYQQTEKDVIFDAYKQFFEQLLIGQKKLSKKERWDIERPIRISIIDDIQKIGFQDIVDESGVISSEFKLVAPKEPVINISPFYLTLRGDDKLSIAMMNDEGIIGLQLTYPKVVSWKADNFSADHETTAFATNQIFTDLVKRIKGVAHKAKVTMGSNEFKPNFWISDEAARLINQNKYLRLKQLIIT